MSHGGHGGVVIHETQHHHHESELHHHAHGLDGMEGGSDIDPLGADGEVPQDDAITRMQTYDPKKKYNMHAHGVKLGIYTSWIKEELDKEGACLEMPFTIGLLLAFFFMSLGHLSQPTVMKVERAIAEDIAENANFAWAHAFGHKGIYDVNSYADFWSWTRVGFIPLVTAPWSYSEGLGEAVPQQPGFPAYDASKLPTHWQFHQAEKLVPVNNDYLRYNRIIGGIRFRQQVAEHGKDLCVFPGNRGVFEKWLGKKCSPTHYGELAPDLQEAETFENPERVEWLMTETGSTDKVLQQVVDMEDGCASATAQNRTCLCEWCKAQNPPHPWLNELTVRLEISFVIFNPSYGIYSYASINFWFNRAGHIRKLINIKSVFASLFLRPLDELILILMGDTIWLLMCAYVVWAEGKEIITLIFSKNKRWFFTIVDDYLGFWNGIDWISIFLASTIIVFFATLTAATAKVNDHLGNFAKMTTSGESIAPSTMLENVKEFYDLVEDMLANERSFRLQMCIYPMVLMLRLFKSFAAQPRLAVVTETFVEAKSDIFHFLIVFLSVYICMVVNAILFFGQDCEEFTNFPRAMHACFLVMWGDWDYDQLAQIGRIKASLWLWMFMIIVNLILLNITLAIIMEAYGNVKKRASDEMGLFEQIKKQIRRYKQAKRGQRVRLNDIFAALKFKEKDEDAMLVSERTVFPKDLLDTVPNLNETQAVRTLTDAQEDFDKDLEGFDIANMQPNLQGILSRMDNSVTCASWLEAKVDAYAKAEERLHAAGRTTTYDQQDAPPVTSTSDGLSAVRRIAQDRTTELSDAVEAVLQEEMQDLERRQKEQQKAMEQMQASLTGLRSLAHKLSQTCHEVTALSQGVSVDGQDIGVGKSVFLPSMPALIPIEGEVPGEG
mmetsp:Transcript_99937/g.177316  ORF Transcript_99937/g.177316 Transcript_99937/m.177316 type:complete len:892 (+) Transcript_99937:97-2772(+)